MDNSPSRKVWLKFKRNRLAFAGLIFILLLMAMGILGYLIVPVDSPDANTQTVQISKAPMGAKFKFLIIQRYANIENVNFFERMMYGQKSRFKSIPITAYKVAGNSVLVHEYIGKEEASKESAYQLKELCPNCLLPNKMGTREQLFEKNNIYEQTFLLGTDIYGRDLLSRLILGIRVSLSVGLMAVLISLFIGISLGAIAGYFGGRVDAAISWFMNVVGLFRHYCWLLQSHLPWARVFGKFSSLLVYLPG